MRVVGKEGALGGGDICMVVFGSIAHFSLHARGSSLLTALQTAGAFVCAHDYRATRKVKAVQPL